MAAVLALVSPLAAVQPAQAAVRAPLSLSAPASVETGLAFSLAGYGYPARPGRTVVVQRLSGRTWVEVGRTTQAANGLYVVRTYLTRAGRFAYRAVALSWRGAPAVASVARVVSAHVPYILITPSTAMAGETVRVTGLLPGVYSRPVWVQRRSGASWVTVARATTSRSGSYTASYRAPAAGVYLRTLAPRVTISRVVRAQYVTAAKTLSVVAQTASLTIPAALVQGQAGTATMRFTPARPGRAVALQVQRIGVWTSVSTGVQSAAGTASFAMTGGTPAVYSYQASTALWVGAPASVSLTRTLSVTTGPVTQVTATPATTSILLSWTNPPAASLTGVMIRRSLGGTPPATITAGDLVTDSAAPATSFTDSALEPGTLYSYALFAHDGTPAPVYATGAGVSATTDVGAVSLVEAIPASTSIALSWTNPLTSALTGVMIRRAEGPTAPLTATAGDLVTDSAAPATSFTDTGRTSGTQYSYALFAHDVNNVYATGFPVTATTFPIPGAVTSVATVTTTTSITLSWVNPESESLIGVMIRRAEGSTPPASATTGEEVTDADTPANSFTDSSLTPGTRYSYAFFAHDGTPAYSPRATISANTILLPVTEPLADPATTSIDLSWDNPDGATLTGVMIRRAEGATAPASATEGTGVTDADYPATSFTDIGLEPGTQYSYAFFAHDETQVYAASATFTSTTEAPGRISGTVTDAGGTHQALANVTVRVSTAFGTDSTTTAADGTYLIAGLAADDYTVCFYASGATGGSSDVFGYVDQCYNDVPTYGEPMPVTVTSNTTTPAVSAALAGGGAISGTVTEAETAQGLANVLVVVASDTGAGADATTDDSGKYTVKGLPAGDDYEVCFDTSSATGGSAADLGYVNECHDSQPATGVQVTIGENLTGLDAALASYGAISGKVTDPGGTQGLANVRVEVYSSGGDTETVTAADGGYVVPRLAEGTDYTVCFFASGATGGSSEALGYFDQCYDSQATSGTRTPVAVTLGTNTEGIDAALVVAGAISGTVTDAEGIHDGLAGVQVQVYSLSTGTVVVTTAADGTYVVPRLTEGSTYTVRFFAADATGGSSTTGYVDQIFDRTSTSGTPTPVTVTVGSTRSGVDAALAHG